MSVRVENGQIGFALDNSILCQYQQEMAVKKLLEDPYTQLMHNALCSGKDGRTQTYRVEWLSDDGTCTITSWDISATSLEEARSQAQLAYPDYNLRVREQ